MNLTLILLLIVFWVAISQILIIIEPGKDKIYEEAAEEAAKDIKEADGDIIRLLDMAGFDGKAYYESNKKYAY